VQAWSSRTLELLAEAPTAHGGEKVLCAAVGANGVLFTGGDDQVGPSDNDDMMNDNDDYWDIVAWRAATRAGSRQRLVAGPTTLAAVALGFTRVTPPPARSSCAPGTRRCAPWARRWRATAARCACWLRAGAGCWCRATLTATCCAGRWLWWVATRQQTTRAPLR
jgi:hypothetical protein